MLNTDEQIKISSDAIDNLIDRIDENDRGFLSQNIIDKLRTFVEAISVKASGEKNYSYEIYQTIARDYVSARANLNFLIKFHKYLQRTVSHYLPNENNSERLMLKYYEYLIKIKSLLKVKYNLDVLENIKSFPISIDPALKEYYEKIAEKINEPNSKRKINNYDDRYYIKKIKPFFFDNEIYYEITFTTAIDNISKFDRVIAFTKLNILQNYAVKLSVSNDIIEVLGKKMPIQIIDKWEISIRPCEFNRFADIFGNHKVISMGSVESHNLMILLAKMNCNLVDIMELSNKNYDIFKNKVIFGAKTTNIFDILDKARGLIKSKSRGSNIIRYLLYNLNNKIIKLQYADSTCQILSNLKLNWSCIPFDDMPFATSPIGHNPKIHDLFDCIDVIGREDELLARFIKNNTEQKGILYTPEIDLNSFENIDLLINSFNDKIYSSQKPIRDLEKYKKHIYINGYENDTLHIIEKLKVLSINGFLNYSNSVNNWIISTSYYIDCEKKKEHLKSMFEKSKVALIYGAAGTGKTKQIEHISSFFSNYNKLYLANTNPAIANLKRRVNISNSTFLTIASYLANNSIDNDNKFDLLIIDECSTVNNKDMLKVLEKASFELLVLVGDVFQIESIRFGNWFSIAKFFMPETSIFELTTPYRTTDSNLLTLWNKVRNITDDIFIHLTNNNYSSNLDNSIFQYSDDDEIILCLNYDGLYGINNINRFLQGNNLNESKQWGIHTYKINDPILFNESNRFKPLIHNNLKGKILDIKIFNDKIQFDIEIDKSINEFDTLGYELELVEEFNYGKSVIRFSVNKLPNTDEDNENSSAVVPFQVAYAVTIHKAQGLEYNSVKIVITEDIEEMITQNIFYTAITRAKEKLRIYWTPDTQNKILSNLKIKFNEKDVSLLKSKFNL